MKCSIIMILMAVSWLWWTNCRGGEINLLGHENRKLQGDLANAEQEIRQLQDGLQKKSEVIDTLGRFVRDFLCDPFGSKQMQDYLDKDSDNFIYFGIALSHLSCGPRSEGVKRLRFDRGDKKPEIIQKVNPDRGWLRLARIQGAVILEVEIDMEGNVRCPCIIHGHPFLNGYAWDAVMRWKYRPYLINGKPSRVCFLAAVCFSYDQIQ